MASPPSYTTLQNESSSFANQDIGDMPPPYNATTEDHLPTYYDNNCKPPSYSEVEAIHRQNVIREMFNLSDDEFELEDRPLDQSMGHTDSNLDMELGSSVAFWGCFFLSFILNWIGLLIGYCVGGTYASHCGSLAGFGLSLIKWAILIKHSNCCMDTMLDHPWIMWLFIVTGWLLFLKGTITYIQRKRNQEGQFSLF